MHLILFDIDGTLISGRGMGRQALVRTFAETFDKDPEDYPAVGDIHFAGSTDTFIFAEMVQAFEIPEAALDGRENAFLTAYMRNLRESVAGSSEKKPCPGIPEVLDRLDAHPQTVLGLLTGNWEVGARIKLEPFGLNRHFPFGGFGDDGADRGTLARCARERAEAHTGERFPGDRVLVVGDTVADVAAARSQGFRMAGVATGWDAAGTLEAAGADAVFPDLTPGHGFLPWLDALWSLSPPLA
jgi:phosphoglycolate phosphatase-like HAD superfamily hydrolase